MTAELRGELDRLTIPEESLNRGSPASDWKAWLDAQAEAIVDLAQRCPHDIRLEQMGAADEERNCIMFALGIDPDAIRDWTMFSVHPGEAFVAALIDANVLRCKTDSLARAKDGDIAVYFRDGKPVHAGLVRGDRIISKWGSGPTSTWDHRPFEVPQRYGHEIRFYHPLVRAEDFYRAWAESKGVVPEDS